MQGNPAAVFSRLVLTIRIFSVHRVYTYTYRYIYIHHIHIYMYIYIYTCDSSTTICESPLSSQAALPVMLSFRFSRLGSKHRDTAWKIIVPSRLYVSKTTFHSCLFTAFYLRRNVAIRIGQMCVSRSGKHNSILLNLKECRNYER